MIVIPAHTQTQVWSLIRPAQLGSEVQFSIRLKVPPQKVMTCCMATSEDPLRTNETSHHITLPSIAVALLSQ